MQGMTKSVPEPQPIRYTRVFTKDEVIFALKHYLESAGVKVPKGRDFLWGLEVDSRGYCSPATLVI